MGVMTHTVSGNPVRFLSADKAKIDSLKVSFSPVQAGSGDPSPSNARPISGISSINVWWRGTNLIDDRKRYQKGDGYSLYFGAYTSAYETYLKAGTYRFTAEMLNGASYDMYYRKEGDSSGTLIWAGTDNVTTATFTLSDDGYYRFNMTSAIASNVSNCWLTYGEGEYPYSEYKPNFYSVTFPALGKNLLNPAALEQGGIAWTGNDFIASNRVRTGFIPVEAGEKYTVSATGFIAFMHFYDADKGNIGENVGGINITAPEDAKFVRCGFRKSDDVDIVPSDITDGQLEEGSTATSYEPYTNTCYGGSLDLTTGDVVATHKSITFTGAESEEWHDGTYSGYPRFWAVVDGAIQRTGRTYVLGNIGIYNANEHAEGTMFIYHSGSTLLYYYPPNTVTTVADFKTWLSSNNLQAVYELQTPIVVNTLTPVELKAFVGENNLWSNANSNTAVTYEFTDYLKKKAMSLYNPEFIPPAYKEYDYLSGYGHRARIDTGVSGDDETLQIHCTFMPIELTNSYTGVLGNYQTETDTRCWRIILQATTSTNYQKSFYVCMGTRAASGTNGGSLGPAILNSDETTMIGKKITADLSFGKCTMTCSKTYTNTLSLKDIPSSTNTIAIGASRPSIGESGTTVFRFYKFTFRSHGKIIRNYVPVVRLSDNKAGFFDTVNGTFNPSIGSYDFVAGNDN